MLVLVPVLAVTGPVLMPVPVSELTRFRAVRGTGPIFDFLRNLLDAMPSAVQRNLHRLYLIHPSLKMRFAFLILGAG